MLRLVVSPLICVLLACGDAGATPTLDGGSDGSVDASSDAAPGATVAAPAPPAPPLPPALGPCRAGWVSVDDDGVAVCQPFPIPTPACADFEALFPGTSACARVGDPCGADEWPTDLPSTGVIYVQAGAVGGTGSRAAPLGRVVDATAAAAPGTTVALARGEYVESAPVGAGITVRGACVEGTVLRAPAAVGSAPTLEVTGAGARIENLTITGPRPGVRALGAGRSATLTDVIIDAATSAGITVGDGAELVGEAVVVRRTASTAGAFGRGINVESGGALTLTRAVIADNRETGIIALGGATVRLTDVLVRATAPVDGFGDAVGVELGSSLECAGCVLEDNAGVGAYVTTDATLDLEDSVVRGNDHEGLQVSFGATATLARLRIEGNAEGGILCDGEGSGVSVTDALFARQGHRALATQAGASSSVSRALIRDNGRTRALSALYVNGGDSVRSTLTLRDVRIAGHPAAGVQAQAGAEVSLDRVAITGARGTGVALHTGLVAAVRDLYVSNAESTADEPHGRGLEVGDGTEFTLERVLLEDIHEIGALFWDSAGTITDFAVRDVTVGADGRFGRGLELQHTVATIERARIERARGTGFFAGQGSTITASDIEVLDTRSNGPLLVSGHALTVNSGARAEIDRARFVDNREVTVVVFEAGTSLELRDVAIRRSLPRQCTAPICAGFGAGIGLGVYEGGRATARGFVIAESALAGVQLVAGELDLFDGEITDNPIGINVQIPDYPLERHTTRVSLHDNGRNVDGEFVPVPEHVEPAAR